MANFFFFVALVNALAVIAVLICGLYVDGKGGDLSKKWSNKLMQLRVWLQATTLLFLAISAMIAHR
jgi:hypothetical protein